MSVIEVIQIIFAIPLSFVFALSVYYILVAIFALAVGLIAWVMTKF